MNSEANRLLLEAISKIARAAELLQAEAIPPPAAARPRRDHASTVRELERWARTPLPVMPVEPPPMPVAEPTPMAEPAQPAAEAAAPKARRARTWTPEQRQAAADRMRATMAKHRMSALAAEPTPTLEEDQVPAAPPPPAPAPAAAPAVPAVVATTPSVVDDPLEDARNLLAAGVSVRQVAEETGLPLSKVSGLAFALREQRAASAGTA